MSLILPMVVIVITGLAEFTWIFWNFVAIGNAASAGARRGAVGGNDVDVTYNTTNSMIGIEVTTVTIEVFDGSGNRVQPPGTNIRVMDKKHTIKVTAHCPYEYLTILPNMVPGMFQLQELRGQSTALIESNEPAPFTP